MPDATRGTPDAVRQTPDSYLEREASSVERSASSVEPLRILLLGDVCGEPGRAAVEQALPGLKQSLAIDFTIANCENAAAGYGVTPRLADGLLKAGVDCLTTGDHVYDRKDVWCYLGTERRILRPLNLPPEGPGRGTGVYEIRSAAKPQVPSDGSSGNDEVRSSNDGVRTADGGVVKVAVVNLLGRVFMKPSDCPFRRSMPAVNEIRSETPIVVVDFHAEATAEKQALGCFLDGRVTAVLGTHTHVQTADERILPGGTACISDVGMCGSFDSVLGMNRELSVQRMVDLVPVRLVSAHGDVRLNGVLVDVDRASGRALAIRRIVEPVSTNQTPESSV